MAKKKEEKVEIKDSGKGADIVPEGTTTVTDVITDVITDVELPKELLEKYDKILEETPKIETEVIEPKEKPKEEPSEKATEPAGEEVEEEIPDRLVDAGRAMGLTDEQIVLLAEKQMPVLETLENAYRQLVEARATVKEAPKPEPEQPKIEPAKHLTEPDLRDFDDNTAGIVKTLISGYNALADKFNAAEERLGFVSQQVSFNEAAKLQEYDRIINSVFDETTTSEYGKTKILGKEQLANRQETYLTAALIAKQRGLDIRDALRGVLNTVNDFGKVRSTDKATDEDKTVKLEKQKAKMTVRPTGQKTARYAEMQPRDREFEKFSDTWNEIVGR